MTTSRRTAYTLSNYHVLAVAAVALGACAGPRAPTPTSSAAASIVAELQASADAFNRGDLDGFLAPYLDSSTTTFMTGPGVIRGLATIRERYRASYWKAGSQPPQVLRFEQLAVRPLDRDYALVTGRFVLNDRASGAGAASGNFTLVYRRTAQGWRIIHDHSSAG